MAWVGKVLKILRPLTPQCVKNELAQLRVPCPTLTPQFFLPQTVPLLGPYSALEPTPMAGR